MINYIKLYFICVTYGLPYFSFRFVSLRFFFVFFSFSFVSFLFSLCCFRFFLRFVFFFVSFRYFSPCFLFVFFFFPFLFVFFFRIFPFLSLQVPQGQPIYFYPQQNFEKQRKKNRLKQKKTQERGGGSRCWLRRVPGPGQDFSWDFFVFVKKRSHAF